MWRKLYLGVEVMFPCRSTVYIDGNVFPEINGCSDAAETTCSFYHKYRVSSDTDEVPLVMNRVFTLLICLGLRRIGEAGRE